MKYMLLIYGDEKSWEQSEREACYKESAQLCQELASRGQYVSASPLQPIASATSVRVRSGKPVITDGPFAETREQLGGYFMVEANDLNDAINKLKRGESIPAKSCKNPIAREYKLGQQIGVTGTPTIVLEDGELEPGYAPAAELAERLGLGS